MKKEKPKTRIKYADTWEKVEQLVQYCKTTGVCSFDFETDGTAYHAPNSYPTILGVSFQPGSAYIIPLGHFESPFRKKDEWVKVLQYFGREVMMDKDIIKIAHNLKFEWKWMKKYGIDMVGRLFDNMLAKYLLNENSKMGLKEVVDEMLPRFAGYDDELSLIKKKHGGDWSKIPMKPLSEYCGLDCDLTLRLMQHFHTRLIKKGFYQLFRNLLMMATRVLAESEFHGMHIDEGYLDRMIEEYQHKVDIEQEKLLNHPRLRKYQQKIRKKKVNALIDETTQEIRALLKSGKPSTDRTIKSREEKINRYLAGEFNTKKEQKVVEAFNFNSPQQVVDFFYKSPYGMKWPPQMKKNKKTKQMGYTTDEGALEKLKAMDDLKGKSMIIALLEFRGLVKLHSTYFVGMKDILDDEGFIHPDYHLLTVTGRLGCREPNMQNIPRVTTNPDVKPMFTPIKGSIHYELDYSQAELRVVAELAEDEVMIDIFRRGWNIHMGTACLLHGDINIYDYARSCEKDENHKEHIYWVKLKKKAKSLNFQILYGGGAKAVSEAIGTSEKEAQVFINKWLDAYPGIKAWIGNQHDMVSEHGYVMSIFGRRRRLPDIWDDRFWVREKAERDSVNAPIQGSASDYTQLSSIVIREKRLKGELPAYLIQRYTVHDSLGYYMKADAKEIEILDKKLIEICLNPNTLDYFGFEMKHVKMKVSTELGLDWGHLNEIDGKNTVEAIFKKIAA